MQFQSVKCVGIFVILFVFNDDCMDFSLFIARRLSLSSGGRRTAPAVGVATAAVALSVAVMIASIAVVGGFKREIRDKVVGFNSHLTVSASASPETGAETGGNLVSLTPSLRKILDNEPYAVSYSLEAAMPAILKTPSDFKGVYFKALDGEEERAFIRRNLVGGTVPDFSRVQEADSALGVVVSETAARQLGLEQGGKVDVYFISDGVKVRRMRIDGVFNSHFDAYDNIYIYGAKALIDDLAGIDADKGTALHVTTTDFDRVDEYAARLTRRLVEGYADGELYRNYKVETAKDRGRGYFSWLALLDTNVAVVLALMTVVACITLISGLLIIILDKIAFVGIMKALGASNRSLRRVFVYLALKVTVAGLLIGNALMVTILAVQDRTHFIPLDPESYYIDFVPVEFSWGAIAALDIGVFVVAWLALILPSHFVARISPASTMRYE